jgi:hypothetical protein
VPEPKSIEPLNFPLNFSHTDKANAKSGASLLRQGDYHAIEKRVYAELQLCGGCATREKAKTLILIRDRLTGEQFEVGLECMKDLYGVDVATLNTHASSVVRTRLQLAQKLGLTGALSTERQMAIVREAVLHYVPVPKRLLQELDGMDPWILGTSEGDRIRDLHQLACYHQEWQDNPARARWRWQALGSHPAFMYTPNREEVRRRCTQALNAESNMPERDILALNGWLRKAAAFQDRTVRLVDPADFTDQDGYVQSLHFTLETRVQSGAPIDHILSGNTDARTRNPLDFVRLDNKILYSVAGVWEDDADTFASRIEHTESYWKKVRRPLVAIGPAEVRAFPAEMGIRRNEENELETYQIHPAWTFRFRRVAWALVEAHTPTFALWGIHGRAKLDRYL